MKLPQKPFYFVSLLFLAGIFGSIMVLAGSYLYLGPGLPPAEKLKQVELQIPLRVYTEDGVLIGEFGEKRRAPVSFSELPTPFVMAVLAAEDERFFKHGGVDIKGLLRAVADLVRYQQIRSGGSTITMQVARNFFLGREQKFLRKFNEIVLALQIEDILSKEDILELYLNKIYLGHRSYGAEAAAQVYYGKSIKELALPQWAMIAGLPKAPSAYNPITNPERALIRRNWILKRMLEIEAITPAAFEEAVKSPVTARYHGPRPEIEASHLAEMVRSEVIDMYGLSAYTSGMEVFTTLDSRQQASALQAVRAGIHEYEERHGYRGPENTVDITTLPDLTEAISQYQSRQTQLQQEHPADTTDENTAAADTQPEAEKADNSASSQPIPAEQVQPWINLLKEYNKFGQLEPAIVFSAEEEHSWVILQNGTPIQLTLEDVEWAKPYINPSITGKTPEKVSAVLSPGDIIRVRPLATAKHAESQTSSENDLFGLQRWRLAQAPQAQGALVSLDPNNGAVRALVGGYSFTQSHFNRSIQGGRQAGSVFKPFIYSSGLYHGLTPATLINDAPVVFEDSQLETAWRPTGAGSKFYGPTRMREALYRSLNLVSIRILQQVGINNALEIIKQFGLPTEELPRDLSLALGSATLTPMQIASAYSVFANGGYLVNPWYIDRIQQGEDNIIWQAEHLIVCDKPCEIPVTETDQQTNRPYAAEDEKRTEKTTDEPGKEPSLAVSSNGQPEKQINIKRITPAPRVVDEQVVWLMDSMLKDVIRRGTGYKARSLGRNDLAGKTGTTNEQFDAWFSGYSPHLVTTVWVGFDTPATLGRGEYGGRAALPIWMYHMEQALEGKEEIIRPQPAGIVSVRINKETGKRARPGDPDAVFEYFRESNVPDFDTLPQPQNQQTGPMPEQLF